MALVGTRIITRAARVLLVACFSQSLGLAVRMPSPPVKRSSELWMLEVILTCEDDWRPRGAPLEWRFRLFEDLTAEYLVSLTRWNEPREQEILLKKRMRLTREESDRLINQAESRPFLESAPQYTNSKFKPIHHSSNPHLITITYKTKGTHKKIYLKNYLGSIYLKNYLGSGESNTDPPEEVGQFIKLVFELCDQIEESGK